MRWAGLWGFGGLGPWWWWPWWCGFGASGSADGRRQAAASPAWPRRGCGRGGRSSRVAGREPEDDRQSDRAGVSAAEPHSASGAGGGSSRSRGRPVLELRDQLVELELLQLARDLVELALAEPDQVLRLGAERQRLPQLGLARVEPGDDLLETRGGGLVALRLAGGGWVLPASVIGVRSSHANEHRRRSGRSARRRPRPGRRGRRGSPEGSSISA